jgi:hypothetical protein
MGHRIGLGKKPETSFCSFALCMVISWHKFQILRIYCSTLQSNVNKEWSRRMKPVTNDLDRLELRNLGIYVRKARTRGKIFVMKLKFFRAQITVITNADYGGYERYPNVSNTLSTLYQLHKHPWPKTRLKSAFIWLCRSTAIATRALR